MVPVITRKSRYPLNAVVTTGDLSRKGAVVQRRCVALNNKTIQQALQTTYIDNTGKRCRYLNSDLNYDVRARSLTVSMPSISADVVNATFSTLPDTPAVSHVDGVTSSTFDSSYFSTSAGAAIRDNAYTDPLFDNDPWVVRLDLDGQVQHYAIERDLSPDRPVVASTFKLSDKDTTFMSHKHLLRAIDNHDRKQDILHAIASEYESFDQRGVWKLTLLPDGAKLHKMMLLIKVKMLADGTEERVKARAVLLGNDYRPGIDFGDNTYAPCAQIRTARMMVADAVQHRKCIKACDAKQAFTNGQAERRVFVQAPPGRVRDYDDQTGEPYVYEITKNCYGSPTAPRQWNIELHNSMIQFGFRQRTSDQSLYTLGDLSVLVYTDDFMSTYPDTVDGTDLYRTFINMLKSKYELRDDGMQDCVDFVGLHFEFNSDRSVCHITQPLKLQQLFDISGLSLCRPQFTPGMPNVLVSSLDCPSPDDKDQIEFMKSKPYRKRVGQLL